MHSPPQGSSVQDQLRLHALAGNSGSAMDVDLAIEQALDKDEDGGMMDVDDDGEVDPMGHVKGGRGAALYPAPELPLIRDGMARLKELRQELEQKQVKVTPEGVI